MGHRDVRAPRPEPARRGRDGGAAQRDDAQEERLTVTRRRRSLHFVPGGNDRMLAKALTLPADGLILDLEDAVAPDRKAVTRRAVREWLGRDFGGRRGGGGGEPVPPPHRPGGPQAAIATRPRRPP